MAALMDVKVDRRASSEYIHTNINYTQGNGCYVFHVFQTKRQMRLHIIFFLN